MEALRILIVDDSTLYRKVIRDALSELPGVKVIGSANNGTDALERISFYRPDLVTLDIEMPQLSGLEVLERLQTMEHDTGVIMLSSLTSRGASATTRALSLGAFDFVLKPEGQTLEQSVSELKHSLLPRVRAFASSRRRSLSVGIPNTNSVPLPQRTLQHSNGATSTITCANEPLFFSPTIPPNPQIRPEAVAVGISTGGPAALMNLIPKLPGTLKVPVFLVQHMPPVFTRSLAHALNEKSSLRVVEAEDGMKVMPGEVYIAPGGFQMKVVRKGLKVEIEINNDPPENSSRPSVDYTFRSVAKVYGSQVLGVIMTGMGSDGLNGCRDIKRNGGSVITQDESSCVVYGMPRATFEAGLSDSVCELDAIAPRIVETLSGVRR